MEFEEIQNKIKIIINSPTQAIPDNSMVKIRKELTKRAPKSKKLFEEMKNNVPGGFEHQLVLNDPFAITLKKSSGSKQWDVDDNQYLDILSGAGAVILGHNYPQLRDKIIEVMQDVDSACYLTNEYELKAVKEIKKHVKSLELFKFYQSGTEADMAAIRLARVYTKKKKIIKIGGAYHGWSDQLTYDMHVPFSGDLESHGIPSSCFKDTIAVPPNDIDALEAEFKKFEEKKGIAAIILEPLGPESGNIPVAPDYNKAVEELCQKYGSLLIFDEVVTGFRMDMGGAQKYFGVKPDLTTFGKLLTHGFPSTGGLGGRRDIMEYLASGIEAAEEKVMATGTLLGNPLSAAACYYTLQYLEKENAVEKAAYMGNKLTNRLNELFESHGFPFFAFNYKSIVQYKTYAPINMDIRIQGNIEKALYRNQCVGRIATAMLWQNVITKRGASGFTTIAHTDKDLDYLIQAFDTVLKLIPH
ncbi:MAG: aminotransferase class III-fold pyridoxal phosphate-dependent enzyme [Candidatus Lokiarchaeota archaeon]|nr:aminotransferase class III-fold pyridoxal phosphate-dependent enzyme [Candidatus Lokiarchaeota archaeon]